MPSKFFTNKHEQPKPGSRGKQTKPNLGGSRSNNKRNNGVKKSGRGR